MDTLIFLALKKSFEYVADILEEKLTKREMSLSTDLIPFNVQFLLGIIVALFFFKKTV
jgi:hypothetical protein